MTKSILLMLSIMAAGTAPVGISADDGKKLYEEHCGTCHMMDGSGVPMMQPSLIGSAIAGGSKDFMIRLILKGSQQVIEDSDFMNPMPAFDFLSDAEIAKVATYVRSNFENAGESVTAVTAADVSRGRDQ